MNTKKIFLGVVLSMLFVSMVSAELVEPGETRELPQLTSEIPLDTSGTERTYLYCSWRIDGIGQEVVQMNSNQCPETPQEFTFEDDQTYFTRIDRVSMQWVQSDQAWVLTSVGFVADNTIDYELNLPEPEQSLFDNAIAEIFNTVRNFLCSLFPGLGFCE